MTNDDLIKIGFTAIPHFTIGDSVIFDLGRHRQISGSCVGTPNEMLFICEIDHVIKTKITDLVCLHNYDYDGYLTIEKVQMIIDSICMKGSKTK